MVKFSAAPALLLLIAAIWGSDFVAQRAGTENLQTFSFNTARFVLATLSLLPVWWYLRKSHSPKDMQGTPASYLFWWGGLLAGTTLFAAFSFQQAGLQYTTAGSAGLITSVDIVIVSLFSLLLGYHTRIHTWIGIALTCTGLYKLSVDPELTINYGDWLELVSAFFWALHMIILGWLSQWVKDIVGISLLQFVVAAVWSGSAMFLLESPHIRDFQATLYPLLYAGVIACSFAFTLQLMAQRTVDINCTALLLSSEALFALLAGWLILDEQIGGKELLGASLMLAGIIISQWPEQGDAPLIPTTTKKPEGTC